MFKFKRQEGFTLVEVLVAILITGFFVSITMQMMAFAAVFKARARDYSEAISWIQEDLEAIRTQATRSALPLPQTTLQNGVIRTATAIVVSSIPAGIGPGDYLMLGRDNNNVIASGGINTATRTITLREALGADFLAGTPVFAKCMLPENGFVVNSDGSRTANTAATYHSLGLAAYLNNNLPTRINNGSKTVGGTTYILSRSPSDATRGIVKTTYPNGTTAAPYQVLEFQYRVVPQGGSIPAATLTAEVIPEAALQCPPP